MISYKLDDRKIFVVTFEGKMLLDDVMNYLNYFGTINSLPNDIRLLYNFKKAIFKFAPEKIQIIAELADKVTGKYKSIKTAFYVYEPLLTAYSLLFSGMDKNPNRQRQVFSTEEAAVKWLLNDE